MLISILATIEMHIIVWWQKGDIFLTLHNVHVDVIMTLASNVNIIASFLNLVQFKARVLGFDLFGRVNFYF